MVVTRSLLGTQFLANRRASLLGLLCQQCFCGTPYTGHRVVLYHLFLFTAPKLLLVLFTVLGIPFHKWLRWPRTPFICTGLTLAVLSIVMILYGSFVGRTRFEVKEVTYTSPRLPQAFDGYRIVQLSDLHIGSWQGNTPAIRKLVDLVNAQQPDLIVFTGDLVNHRAVELNDFQEILAGLKAGDGVYSILGNHDYGPYFHWKSKQDQDNNLIELKQRQAAMGWKLLNNEHTFLFKAMTASPLSE